MAKLKNYVYNEYDHLAGIVPIGGKLLDFQMPWHDSLMPIAPDYLAIEQAVYQCANAGCTTIWIVGHKGTTPLIRHRLGDWILDPATISLKFSGTKLKEIPIFYVPILPKDYDKRDSLGWSVLFGADTAFRVSAFITKWAIPKRFLCIFPYGITPENDLRKRREEFKKEPKIIFSYNNKTVKDGIHAPFVFSAEDYKKCRDIVKKKNIEDWEQRKEKNAREFTLQEIFEPLDTVNNPVVELSWFHDISSWENYCNYTASDEAKQIKRYDIVFKKEKRRIFPTEKEIRNKNVQGQLETEIRKTED